jgi:hypothetical protein
MLFEVGGVENLLVVYTTVEEAQLQLATSKAAGSLA